MINIEGLSIKFDSQLIVDNLSFNLSNEKLAIVGGSGSGKSMTAKALLNLVPFPGIVHAKSLKILGKEYSTCQYKLHKLRGNSISMITQDPKISLNPVIKVGRQIKRCVTMHQGKSRANDIVMELLSEVKIPNPNIVYHMYPHQISGGMAQRIMIAMMLACKAKIIIADEATSALDKDLQQDILNILDNLHRIHKISIIMISHDLRLVGKFCDRVVIINKGKHIETCDTKDLLNSCNEYTKLLLNCMPSAKHKGSKLMESND